MIVNQELRFVGLLRKEIGDRTAATQAQLEDGVPQDFAAYRYTAGYLKALRDVVADIETVQKKLSE